MFRSKCRTSKAALLMGCNYAEASSLIRLSVSFNTTLDEVNAFIDQLHELCSSSPLWVGKGKIELSGNDVYDGDQISEEIEQRCERMGCSKLTMAK